MLAEPFTADEYARIAETLDGLANLLSGGSTQDSADEYARLAAKARAHVGQPKGTT